MCAVPARSSGGGGGKPFSTTAAWCAGVHGPSLPCHAALGQQPPLALLGGVCRWGGGGLPVAGANLAACPRVLLGVWLAQRGVSRSVAAVARKVDTTWRLPRR